MKRNARLFRILTGLLTLALAAPAAGQSLYKVSAGEKASRASVIVEGKVVGQQAFWNDAHTMIFTANQVEVYKIFKGSLQKDTIEVITVGGTVGDFCIQASHQLSLETGDLGVFYCHDSYTPLPARFSGRQAFDVYSSSQGFLQYDLARKTASAPFERYDDITRELYPALHRQTGQPVRIRNRRFQLEELQPARPGEVINHSELAPVISSFDPLTVDAGALEDPDNNILTIRGADFGTGSGEAAVLFSDADNGTGTFYTIGYDNKHVISWTNTEIRLRVPTRAGSGTFRVRDHTGATASSPSPLDIRYSVLTGEFGTQGFKQFNLVNYNGNGGYSIKYSVNTANNGVNINTSPAKTTFQRALNTWKETTGVNFAEAGTTNLQVVDAYDGENIIMFDNGGKGSAPLAAGILATCISGASVCGSTGNAAYKTGFDIVLRNEGFSQGSTALTFGPCPPYSSNTAAVDLETVLLHELGHALNLGHIIAPLEGFGGGTSSPAKVMHYSVTMNQRRISLDHAAKLGAEYLLTPRGNTYGGCLLTAPQEMSLLEKIAESKDECPADFPIAPTPMFATANFDLVHATSNKFVDPAYNQMRVDGSGTSVTNTAYYPLRTNAAGGALSIEVMNYTTEPEAIAGCTPGSAGVEVSGVKLAIYELPACPAGGAFPLPVAALSFNADGSLPVISGLAANTSYLLVADGVQNTKAAFDLKFSGPALVSRISLEGNIVNLFNHLSWKIDTAFDVSTLSLERSADGISFTELLAISMSAQDEGIYTDELPLAGNNYYRLVLTEKNGSIQYSEVLLISRSDQLTLRIYPNPATQTLHVQVLNPPAGRYGISLHNSLGQRVIMREVTINGSDLMEMLSVSKLSRGIYYLTVYGQDGKRIRSATVKLK